MYHTTISVIDAKSLLPLFGTRDQHLRQICDTLDVNISTRDDQIHVEGKKGDVAQATEVLERLTAEVNQRGSLAADEVSRVLATVQGKKPSATTEPIEVIKSAHPVRPRTPGQERYVRAIRENDLVFAIGPAGTGKTYLAVAMAVEALKKDQIRKIVLVRPAVEAGESLGFLPGDMQAKINPYLRPLLDALREMMDYDQIKQHMEQDLIEVIPLAYMRGRTLNEAFIILDEAQNTTVGQMKMLLTRLGMGSKVVVSGDVTQMDLPAHTKSGLVDGLTRLKSIEGFGSVTLNNSDIVRHQLVRKILRAYEEGVRKRR